MTLNKNAKAFLIAATEMYGLEAELTREQIQTVVDDKEVPYPYWFVTKPEYRAERGLYKLPFCEEVATQKDAPKTTETNVLRQKKLLDESDTAIPEKFTGFVPFGFYKDLHTIVSSKQFYPVFITGLSGNGKTLMVEQVCASLKRECIRVNISIETDETDLIGSNTLVDGNVVYRDGPVITAMKRGAILLIDEVDRGSNKLMCMQGILEGKPYFNKKSGEYIHPTEGFNVVATANTKGQGSEDGKFLAQILDSAFLDRFCITVEQDYPSDKIELRILKPLLNDDEYAENLVKWADVIRKTYAEGGIDEIISTRRLVHIAKTYSIFKDQKKAIELCVSRFDAETKDSFMDLYSKVAAPPVKPEAPTKIMTDDVEIPF